MHGANLEASFKDNLSITELQRSNEDGRVINLE